MAFSSYHVCALAFAVICQAQSLQRQPSKSNSRGTDWYPLSHSQSTLDKATAPSSVSTASAPTITVSSGTGFTANNSAPRTILPSVNTGAGAASPSGTTITNSTASAGATTIPGNEGRPIRTATAVSGWRHGTGTFSSVPYSTSRTTTLDSVPLCAVHQDPNGGDGASPTCSVDTYCECSSGSIVGNYATMTSSDFCGWTTIPKATWTGSVCETPSPTPPPERGKYIFTQTDPPETGANTIVYACTSTTHLDIGAPFLLTECVDKTPISTIIPTQQTPTGSPTPSCYTASEEHFAAQKPLTIFPAAINVFCGAAIDPYFNDPSADGITLDSNTTSFLWTRSCFNLAGANTTVDCDPLGGAKLGWESGLLYANLGFKLIPDSDCVWTVDTPTCIDYLSTALSCPAGVGAAGSNECVAWTISLGFTALANTNWTSSPG